jgi:NAD(P)-dependent dehydrogenase (short-subunit alcohol dehydrogenase family)
LVRTGGYDAARQWCIANPATIRGGYIPSKQAVVLWTKIAAMQLASDGIRINCTSPGPTTSPMNPDAEAMVAELTDSTGRAMTTAEQADVLLFLNSSSASAISGANLVTDGGMSLVYERELLDRAPEHGSVQ